MLSALFVARSRHIGVVAVRRCAGPAPALSSTSHHLADVWFGSIALPQNPNTPSCSSRAGSIHSSVIRSFSIFPSFQNKTEDEEEDDPSLYRHPGIQFHPESISQHIFPDKTVYKRRRSTPIFASTSKTLNTTSGKRSRRPLELEHGYFWMIRELRNTQEKPIVANNNALILDTISEKLPTLDVTPLNDPKLVVSIPNDLIQQNRLQDPAAQCTFLALSFRDFGYIMIPDWLNPVMEMYGNNNRVQILRINISEGGWVFRAMAPLLKWMVLRNTPLEERSYSFLYYGDSRPLQTFQSRLGLYNLMTCYVLLLDGLGRLRWIGSGSPTPDELHSLLTKHIPELLPKHHQHPQQYQHTHKISKSMQKHG